MGNKVRLNMAIDPELDNGITKRQREIKKQMGGVEVTKTNIVESMIRQNIKAYDTVNSAEVWLFDSDTRLEYGFYLKCRLCKLMWNPIDRIMDGKSVNDSMYCPVCGTPEKGFTDAINNNAKALIKETFEIKAE